MLDNEIINHLKKAVYDIQIEYTEKEITLRYSVKNHEKEQKNNFWYNDDEEKIAELAQKDQIEIFEFLAEKHLAKNQGYGENPKRFQTPCYLCNQKTLTTLGWSEAGYPDNLERFFCRLCRISFGWIDIKDDPVELQQEMRNHYLTFAEVEIDQDLKRQSEIAEELDRIKNRIQSRRQLLTKLSNL